MNKNISVWAVLFFLILSSCKTKSTTNELNYMQNVEQIAIETASHNTVTTIQRGDVLAVFVSAKNMEVVKPFNQGYYSAQSSVSTPSTVSPTNQERSYLVNSEGIIEFPILGAINVAGKSLEEVQNLLTTQISVYVKQPAVTVKLANFKVTVLGEVARPGQYSVTDINANILTAIGMAGDVGLYAKRDNILLVRTVDGQVVKERINLLDSSFLKSPYFKLKQGDVIYVSSGETKNKLSRQDPNTNLYLAIAGTIIGLAGIFITIFKK